MKSRRDFFRVAGVALAFVATKFLPRPKLGAPAQGGIVPADGTPLVLIENGDSIAPRDSVRAWGKVYWVNWSYDDPGDDSNDGLSPEAALYSPQAAIDKCVDGRGDIVFLCPGLI